MGLKDDVSAISLLLLLACFGDKFKAHASVFNVQKYGGNSNMVKALTNAWKDACEEASPSQILIPEGKYNMGSVDLKGPCKSTIELNVQGTVQAPVDPSKISDIWIKFEKVDGLTVSGVGTFDGQGSLAWQKNNCNKNENCKQLHMNLGFYYVTNAMVKGLTSLNSKNFHVNVFGCKNLTFQQFTITAPEASVNTDGIHISRSYGVTVEDTKIGTGDDCISLGDGSQNIYVTKVTCGPGHGISVGSLGKYKNEQPVSGVYVRDCTISNAENGVRIKSWPGMFGGSASDILFQDIIMNNVANPIIIDQSYCPWNHCTIQSPSKVKISDVSFKNIKGTSNTPEVVRLDCSSGFPCERVELSNINIKYEGSQGPAKTTCSNVKPQISGTLNPAGCQDQAVNNHKHEPN